MKPQMSLKMGHVRSKTRSQGHILKKTCVLSRGHIFSPIIMKLVQNVCLDETSQEFENGSCWVEKLVTRSNLRKNFVCALEATFSVLLSGNLVRMFVWMKSRTSSKMVHVGSKTMSSGQIVEKTCIRSKRHIFGLIIMKLSQNVCLDEIWDEIENGLFWV